MGQNATRYLTSLIPNFFFSPKGSPPPKKIQRSLMHTDFNTTYGECEENEK